LKLGDLSSWLQFVVTFVAVLAAVLTACLLYLQTRAQLETVASQTEANKELEQEGPLAYVTRLLENPGEATPGSTTDELKQDLANVIGLARKSDMLLFLDRRIVELDKLLNKTPA
jgi:hypothetical protein